MARSTLWYSLKPNGMYLVGYDQRAPLGWVRKTEGGFSFKPISDVWLPLPASTRRTMQELKDFLQVETDRVRTRVISEIRALNKRQEAGSTETFVKDLEYLHSPPLRDLER